MIGYVARSNGRRVRWRRALWLAYLPHWRLTEDPEAKLAVFCTGPAVRSAAANFVTEAIATAMLVFGVLAIGANAEGWVQAGQVDLSQVFSRALQPLLVGILVLGIGLSLGGSDGLRDKPRTRSRPAHRPRDSADSGKGSSDWSYAWIPVVAPIVGGIAGAALYTFVGF